MRDLPFADVVYIRLFWGADKARTISNLAEELNVSRRQVEAAVETLRATGAPIVTTGRGVHLTQDPNELMDSYRRLRSRALRQLANLRALRRTAVAMRGVEQTRLWDVA